MKTLVILFAVHLILQLSGANAGEAGECPGCWHLKHRRSPRQILMDTYKIDFGDLTFVVSINLKVRSPEFFVVLCSGILINSTSVLTTASCVTESATIDDIQVHVPTSNGMDSAVYNVEDIQILGTKNTLERERPSQYDVALITIDNPAVEQGNISFAQLGSLKDFRNIMLGNITEEGNCKTVGYGTLYMHDQKVGPLFGYNISITDRDKCDSQEDTISYDDSIFVCAIVKEPPNTCMAETGVPLICEGKVFALSKYYDLSGECNSKAYVFIPLFNIEGLETVEKSPDNKVFPLVANEGARHKRSDEESESKGNSGETTLSSIDNVTDINDSEYQVINSTSAVESKHTEIPISSTEKSTNYSNTQDTDEIPKAMNNEKVFERNVNEHEEKQSNESIKELRSANASINETIGSDSHNTSKSQSELTDLDQRSLNVTDDVTEKLKDVSYQNKSVEELKSFEIIKNINGSVRSENITKDVLRTVSDSGNKPWVLAGNAKDERGCAKSGSNSFLLTDYPLTLDALKIHLVFFTSFYRALI